MAAVEPPRVGAPPAERADAARNRARVLAAAAEIFRSREDPRPVAGGVGALGGRCAYARGFDRGHHHRLMTCEAEQRDPAPLINPR